jgi:hypothetical protein
MTPDGTTATRSQSDCGTDPGQPWSTRSLSSESSHGSAYREYVKQYPARRMTLQIAAQVIDEHVPVDEQPQACGDRYHRQSAEALSGTTLVDTIAQAAVVAGMSVREVLWQRTGLTCCRNLLRLCGSTSGDPMRGPA